MRRRQAVRFMEGLALVSFMVRLSANGGPAGNLLKNKGVILHGVTILPHFLRLGIKKSPARIEHSLMRDGECAEGARKGQYTMSLSGADGHGQISHCLKQHLRSPR
jgi:hypothetical protein